MATVPWYELDGERVERFVSILLLRRFPDGTRRRTTQGDGGIDVIVPVSDNPLVVDVYQIKKFYEPITSDNKQKIKASITRLLAHVEQESFTVREWHLTLPVEGSDVDQQWLRDQFADSTIVPRWKGRAFLDGLCSEFRDVVDYYIHDGQERLHELVRIAMQLPMPSDPGDGDAGLTTNSIYANIESTFLRLNASDPHYRYNLAMVDPEDANLRSAPPSAVMSEFLGGDLERPVLRIDVFPRYLHATEDRPITSTVRFNIPDEARDVANALHNFRIFGDDLTVPADFATISIDDPISGRLDGQSMNIRISTPSPAEQRRIRLIVSGIDGTRVAFAYFNVQRVSTGTTGLGHTATFVSDSGLISIDLRSAHPDAPVEEAGTSVFNFVIDWGNKVAAAVIEDMTFVRAMVAPHKLSIANEFTGPVTDLASFEGQETSPVPAWLYQYSCALSALQDYADAPLRLADADSELTVEAIKQTINVASLLRRGVIGQRSPVLGLYLDDEDPAAVAARINESGSLRLVRTFEAVVANGKVTIPDAVFSAENVSARVGAVEGVEQIMLSPNAAEMVELRIWLRRFESNA